MKAFPIIRDLVTDVSFNFEMAKRVPALLPPPMPKRLSHVPTGRRARQEFRKCIECFMCKTSVTSSETRGEQGALPGPRFFIRYAELEMHPLDTNDRRELLKEEMGLGTATSPSAVPKSVPNTFTSPTTRSSR